MSNNANQTIGELMESLIEEIKITSPQEDSSLTNDLDLIFSTTTFGFREVTLLVSLVKALKPTYSAYIDFYSCKPRSIAEKQITPTFIKYSIPHKKSGPLNVAKATTQLNEQWADGKRDKDAAHAVVRLIKYIDQANSTKLDLLNRSLLQRFLNEATRIQSLSITIDPIEDPVFLSKLCENMIDLATDGGNTPQRIIGYLLETQHKFNQSAVKIDGHEDSASTTNTTSKKPGDIQEIDFQNNIQKVYEITVKIFDNQRMQDSYESVIEYLNYKDIILKEITVICRKEDCPNDLIAVSKGFLGTKEFNGLIYIFIDIYEWISLKITELAPLARIQFHEKLNTYVSNTNTSEKVKNIWISLNQD